eukprot:CAMPEP_0174738490 /NCGR_PEP_ID=MMETSP1094-20130205/70021_1 /TAXON_ID=156173 /ORGANISM="Chrysochromulina brevifilum, Strain UTEX LB 985" /LENGTH=504 /DNA_ID=CAMNT_0015941913 /DNA_START=66 /DNA_END=1581 /DNA_ORIENTATION=+
MGDSQRDEESLMRQHMIFFQDADENGDMKLNFDEFTKALPENIRQNTAQDKVRSWFDLADKDGNGEVTMAEFVLWSISMAKAVTGSDVSRILQTGDDDEGLLDELQFTRMARKLGFGEHAHELYSQLPQNTEGVVCCEELADEVRMPNKASSQTMREFLLAMSWNSAGGCVPDKTIDTTGWSFMATDAESARESLAALLKANEIKLSKVFAQMDTSYNSMLSEAEFVNGLTKTCGFRGDASILRDIYASLDDHGVITFPVALSHIMHQQLPVRLAADHKCAPYYVQGSGKVTFDQLNGWLRGRDVSGRQGRLEAAKRLFLRPVSDHEEKWTINTLRQELQNAMEVGNVQVIDLLEAWDGDGSGKLQKREWLKNWKRVANTSPELWYSKVRGAVCNAFEGIDIGSEGSLSINEIDRWLNGEGIPSSPASPNQARRRGLARSRKKWSAVESMDLNQRREEDRIKMLVEASRKLRGVMPTPTSPRSPTTRKPPVARELFQLEQPPSR